MRINALVAGLFGFAFAPRSAQVHHRPPPREVPKALSIPHIDVVIHSDAALVTTDFAFTRDSYHYSDNLDFYFTYGAPGIPIAFEAHLLPMPEGFFSAPLDDAGQSLATEHARQAPSHAAWVIGRPESAGQVVHLPSAALRGCFSASGLVVVRIRAVYAFRDQEASTHSLLMRLGISRLAPLALGEITVRGEGVSVTQPSASLCSSAHPDVPLKIAGWPSVEGAPPPRAPRIGQDDLCVRITFPSPPLAPSPASQALTP